MIHLRSGQQTLLCLVPGLMPLLIGETVHFDVVRESLHYFNPDGNRIPV